MPKLSTLLLAAALVVPGTLAATTATAQVGGIGVVDPQAAIAGTKAWAAARTQIQTTYKTQIAAADARRQALSTELQPLVTAFQTAQRAPGATEASLAPQYQAIQTRENAANQELARLSEPFQRAQAYALEQLQARLPDAMNAAVKSRNVSLLLKPDAAYYAQPAADITATVTQQLDALVPSVNTTPPAGWQPGQQSGAAGAAPAAGARPAAPAASGRRSSGGR
jgi:Skp family chaperone for outer membrane proteins